MMLKSIKNISLLAAASVFTSQAATLTIESAQDWGGSHSSYPASKAIDGNTDWSSRWAASGSPVHLQMNLGSVQKVTDVGVSWGQGDSRVYTFEIWARAATSGDWTKVYDDVSSGTTTGIEVYDIDDIDAQQVRVKTFENTSGSSWTNIQEVEIYDNSDNTELSVATVFDDGTGHASYPASNVIDGNTAFSSRWAASGSPVNITAQLEQTAEVKEVGIAWGKGDSRAHKFEIYARPGTSGDWTRVFNGNSSGTTAGIEYVDITDIEAQQIRIKTHSNTSGTSWTNITEVKLKGAEIAVLLPAAPASSWTYCSLERETCSFSGVKQVAYGEGDNWNYSIEVDSVGCNNTNLGDASPGKGKSCWYRATSRDYLVVDSLDELKAAMSNSDQRIRMKRGTYVAKELLAGENVVFHFDGDNNYLDMTGVTLQVPTALLASMARNPIHSHVTYKISGNNNVFVNGTFENTYPNGQHDVTDFGAHNAEGNNDYWPARQMTEFKVYGDNNEFRNNTITVRGSYPYGYGDVYGKGSEAVVYLRKHAGVNVIGDNTVIDGMNLTVLAFGHGIFMQGADNTTIRNSHVQGDLRKGSDMYNDGANSLPALWNYEQYSPVWYQGQTIDKTRMYNLTEDGIRAYGSGTKYDGTVASTGSVYVENTTVDKMRNCFALVAASHAELDNVQVTRCGENGYSLPNNGVVSNSRGDAAYASLIQMPYGNEKNISMDITVLKPEHTMGTFPMTNIAGSGHSIILRSDGNAAVGSNRLTVGYAWDRWDYDTSSLYRHGASNIEIINQTPYPLELTEYSSDISGSSNGKVYDYGDNNSVD